MRDLLSFILLFAACVYAVQYKSPVRLARRSDVGGNMTSVYSNSTAPSSTTASPTDLSTISSTSTSSRSTSLPSSGPASTNSETTNVSTSTSATISPPSVIFNSTLQASSTTSQSTTYNASMINVTTTVFPAVPLNTTTTTINQGCEGSVTYSGSVPPTVYVTVTEGFTVTITASNMSLTLTETLITPPPACQATIVPFADSIIPILTSVSLTSSADPSSNLTTSALTGSSSFSAGAANGPFQPVPPAVATETTASSAPAIPHAGPHPEFSAAPHESPLPDLTTPAPAAPPAASSVTPSQAPSVAKSSAVYTSAQYTSTVTVTKKTPVPVVVSPTSGPPVFQLPSTTRKPTTSVSGGANNPPDGSSPPQGSHSGSGGGSSGGNEGGGEGGGNTAGGQSNGGGTGQPTTENNGGSGQTTNGNSNGGGAPQPTSDTSGGSDQPAGGNSNGNGGNDASRGGGTDSSVNFQNGQSVGAQNTGSAAPGGQPAESPNGLGNVITSSNTAGLASTSPTASGENGAPAQAPAAAAPASTKIDGVGVTIYPSSVAIGAQTVALPTGSSRTVVTISGNAFTIGHSDIVAPSTTYAIQTVAQEEIISTKAASARVITAAGLTFTEGPSVAVISGTTYRIGPNATPTTIVVHGETVSLGPNGVGLPSTTISPGQITGSPFVVETAGGLTFSVDASEAVISGTTYRIGPNASPTSVIVNGVKVSLGPNGVGLPSTTIPPGAITGSPFVVKTAGGLTFSVDATEAVISGTTYRIGSGAPESTTVIGGKTVSLGPGGVGIDGTTTVKPTTASLSVAQTGSHSRSGSAASATASQSAGHQNFASTLTTNFAVLQMLGWVSVLLALQRLFV